MTVFVTIHAVIDRYTCRVCANSDGRTIHCAEIKSHMAACEHVVSNDPDHRCRCTFVPANSEPRKLAPSEVTEPGFYWAHPKCSLSSKPHVVLLFDGRRLFLAGVVERPDFNWFNWFSGPLVPPTVE